MDILALSASVDMIIIAKSIITWLVYSVLAINNEGKAH